MKTWKLVSGILNCVFCAFISFQSCAVGVVESIENSGGAEGGAGIIVSILILVGGIISIATRNSVKTGNDIALVVVFIIAALIGFVVSNTFGDLKIWSSWALINGVLAIVSLFLKKKNKNSEVTE